MGEELYRQLAGTPATTVLLKPRLAELPTVTAVGMNVLAPVAKNGRLHISMASDTGRVQGFQAGEFRVSDPETRKRAMHDRVGGVTCPWLTLEEVVSRDSTSLKRSIAQARLVVVHSQEIDNAGEKGVGPAVFEYVMQRLRGRLAPAAGGGRASFRLHQRPRLPLARRRLPRPLRPMVVASTRTTACLLGSGGGPRGRGQGRARGPQVRGRERGRDVPGDHGGLRHRQTADELRSRRQQPAGACHPGADRDPSRCSRRGAACGTASKPRPARAWRECTASKPGSRSSSSSRWTSAARRTSSWRCVSPMPRACRSSCVRRAARRGSWAA